MNGMGTTSARISLEAFVGQWSVTRVILDRKGMGKLLFLGTATIEPRSFNERGETLVSGYRSQSSRTYGLELCEDHVDVRFSDGREFIRIGADAMQNLLHICGEDTYRGQLLFPSQDRLIEAWRVKGPRKDYRSLARYSRFAI